MENNYSLAETQNKIISTLDKIKELLLEKNRKYGDSALNPCRIFSKSDCIEQIKVRIDDKLNRIKNECNDEDEDVINDLIGYFVLLKIAKGKITVEKDNNKKSDNTGNHNTGNCNTGRNNAGDCNSGYCNCGNFNSGSWNTGNGNIGYCNSGNRNTGFFNSGYGNTGDFNSGDRNTGSCNSGNFNSGYFNTNDPPMRMFNRETDKKRDEIVFPDFFYDVCLCEWIYECDMTDEEKENNPEYETTSGYLKTCTYMEAWLNAFNEAKKKDNWQEERKKLLSLPNFDYDIFEEITGITKEMLDMED